MSERGSELSIQEIIARYKEVTKTRRRYAIKSFFRIKRGVLGLVILIVLTVLSLASPLIAKNPNARVHAELSKPAWMRVFDPNSFDDFYPLALSFNSEADFQSLLVLTGSGPSNLKYGGYSIIPSGYLDYGSLAIHIIDDIEKPAVIGQLPVGVAFFFKWDHKKAPYRVYFDFAHRVDIKIPPFVNETISLAPGEEKVYNLTFKSDNVVFNNLIVLSFEEKNLIQLVVKNDKGALICSETLNQSSSFSIKMNTSYNYTIEIINLGEQAAHIDVLIKAQIESIYRASQAVIMMNLYNPMLHNIYSIDELLTYLQVEKKLNVPPQIVRDWGLMQHEGMTTRIGGWFSASSRSSLQEPPRTLLAPEVYLQAFFEKGNWIAVVIEVDFSVFAFSDLAKLRQDLSGDVEIEWCIDNMVIQAQDQYYGLMGTDGEGADIFAKIIDGLKISLLVGFIATFANLLIGVSLGLVSGYIGGKVDEVIMRFVDFMMSIPILPFLLVLSFVFFQMNLDPLLAIIIVLSLLGWAGMARTIRSQVLALKASVYVEAARASGASPFYIVRKHILPGVWPLVLVYLMQGVVANILAEAGLSFLGVLKPNWNSLGKMIQEAAGVSAIGGGGGGGLRNWHWVFFPGFILMLIGYAFYAISDAYDEIVNPKRRRRF